MQTIIVDVINEKALRLLKDLEALDLIKVRQYPHQGRHISSTYYDMKRDLLKTSSTETEQQLEARRRDWE